MRDPDSERARLFRDKSECVIDIPISLLSTELVDAYRASPGLAIVEIAGRDSVAAAVKAVGDEGFTDLIPAYAYTGTEHGVWSSVGEAVARLSGRLPATRVHPLLVMGSPRFWQALNGRFMSELIRRYGTISPCIGCHLYLHSVRIPLAVTLGRVPIISGERERHNGALKINQIGEALEAYQALAGEFEVKLLLPLRHISGGHRILDLVGLEWEEGQEQPGCVLSGNYRGVNGGMNITKEQAVQYLETFACPVTREITRTYLEGEIPDHLEIAGRVLGL